MTQTMLEYVLNSMYIAIISAGLDDHQRALANDTLFRCADLECAPARAPEILRRIACNAVNQEAGFDRPPTRPRFKVIQGGAA
jgi:hypothetical protein